MTEPTLRAAVEQAEAALGENLVWLADTLDLLIRQNDPEAKRRLKQLNEAWRTCAKALYLSSGQEARES